MIESRLCVAMALAVTACSTSTPPAAVPAGDSNPAEPTEPESAVAGDRLGAVLGALPPEEQARYRYRHPKETLAFLGIEPGMTVVDTLPGPVWYTGILVDYLGPEGKVIAADYSPEMWTHFGDYSPDPKEKETWTADTRAKLEATRSRDAAAVDAVQYGSVPDDLAGKADAVLIVRAMHHLMRLEKTGGYLTQALSDVEKLLAPGGIVGVVQHRAPESSSDAWATGDQGYVKQSAVVAAFERAGFELVAQSEVNANANDQPTESDFVWRLPPTLATSQGNAELAAQMTAIGESDRMTLRFRKAL